MKHPDHWLAAAAAVLAIAAAAVLGALLPGYSHLVHPLALPGAEGMPRAAVFNGLVFALPGLLLAICAWRLRGRLQHGGLVARLGAAMLLLSTLAYAAQGLLPLDPEDLDAAASRLHASAWTLWLIAFAVGALAYAQASTARGLLRVGAVAIVIAALFGALALPAGLAQRLALLGWFVWMWVAVSRAAASAPGSPPQAGR